MVGKHNMATRRKIVWLQSTLYTADGGDSQIAILNLNLSREDVWDPNWQSTTSSKVAYFIGRLKDIQKCNGKRADRSSLPEKVIIFSQFLEHIYVIEQQMDLLMGGMRGTGGMGSSTGSTR